MEVSDERLPFHLANLKIAAARKLNPLPRLSRRSVNLELIKRLRRENVTRRAEENGKKRRREVVGRERREHRSDAEASRGCPRNPFEGYGGISRRRERERKRHKGTVKGDVGGT